MPAHKKQRSSAIVAVPDNNNSDASSQATTKSNSKKRPRSPSPSTDTSKNKSPKKGPLSNLLKSPTPSNSSTMSTSTQNTTQTSKSDSKECASNNEMFIDELDSKQLDGANIGHEYQALIPKNTHKKFHSVDKFDHTYETCLWKPPIHNDAQHKRWLKDLDAFLKSYTNPHKKKELNEAQLLGIVMVNNYDMESAREDMKHYESTLLQGDTLSMENVKKLRDGMVKHGTDLYAISKEYKIPYKTLINYFYINYNGGNEQTKSLKELEFAFEKKAARSKKKSEKTAVVTRSKGSKPNNADLSPADSKERQRNIVQSVLNKQGVDDRTKYDMANYDNTKEDKDEEELRKEEEENKIRLLPTTTAARRQNRTRNTSQPTRKTNK